MTTASFPEAWTTRLAPLPPLLLDWYDGAARALPWRDDPTPYRVWVSEMMLQQTRVEAVIPYFRRFVAELPDAAALAAVPDERLLKLWEGLGYYSRARSLKKAAVQVVERHGGRLPASFEALLDLPGLGDYAAGAVASIAFGLRVPAVDGNVLRVFARLLDCDGDVTSTAVRRRMRALVRSLLPERRVGDFNQALMELGALICLPNGAPRCDDCPAARLCLARVSGRAATLPVKPPKKARPIEERTVLLLTSPDGLALRRRPAQGLLASMWEPPNAGGWLGEAEAAALTAQWGLAPLALKRCPDARHIFTHVEWRMRVWRISCAAAPPPPGWQWADAEALQRRVALPNAFRAALDASEFV